MHLQRKLVDSSHLHSVGYDPARKVLQVHFRDGKIYEYDGVEQQDHDALMTAQSHGLHFRDRIKRGGFKYRRIQ